MLRHLGQIARLTPVNAAIKTLALIVAAVAFLHNGVYGLAALPIDTGYSRTGMSVSSLNEAQGAGFAAVTTIIPASVAATADLRVGDEIRFRTEADAAKRFLRAGETVDMTVMRDGVQRELRLTAPPHSIVGWRPGTVIMVIISQLLVVAGVVLAFSARRRSGLILGLAFACMSLVGSYTYLWENQPSIEAVVVPIYTLIMMMGPPAILAFALALRAETTGQRVHPGWKIGWVAYVLSPFVLPDMGASGGFIVSMIFQWLGFVLGFVVLALGLRQSSGEARTRYGFLLPAVVLIFLSGTGIGFIINITTNDFSLGNPLVIASNLCSVTGAGIFLYAMLRHRVIDIGFAVNRTLVYGVLSTVLLLAFWFLEWSAEEIIPAETREANILISAGIALAIFLVFHHVRDWVEKAIEHVFFRRWRDNEARLRRFTRETAHIVGPDALRKASVQAMSAFASGADVALYAAEEDGYRLEAGASPGLAARLDIDLAWLVRLRAERTTQDVDLPPGVALILPLPHRNEIIGFFALAPKPGGELYRPDETAVLAESAIKIGLDLHALRIEALEIENREQRSRADVLEAQLRYAMNAGVAA